MVFPVYTKYSQITESRVNKSFGKKRKVGKITKKLVYTKKYITYRHININTNLPSLTS